MSHLARPASGFLAALIVRLAFSCMAALFCIRQPPAHVLVSNSFSLDMPLTIHPEEVTPENTQSIGSIRLSPSFSCVPKSFAPPQ